MLAVKVDELRDANEKVEDLQNSLETLQHLGKLMLAARCQMKKWKIFRKVWRSFST